MKSSDPQPEQAPATHQVILSYSRTDSRQMQVVRDALTAAGLSVWTDEGLKVGTPSWQNAIEQAIWERAKNNTRSICLNIASPASL